MIAFHFVKLVDGAPVLRDGRTLFPIGEWMQMDGDIVICQRGLHASWRAFDALGYAPSDGTPLAACAVEVEDVVTEHDDKFVCRRRKVLAWAPCDDVLRLFARQAALSVLHLWEGEVPAVVRDFLETGNEEIRAAAWAAAWDAARDAARAARDAAADAAWAARDAAWASARAAARAAAIDAARDAAISDLNVTLESMLLSELGYAP